MTQIKKTLSIAGIIALATAPAMADIASAEYVDNALTSVASTQYVQNALSAKADLYNGYIPITQLGYVDTPSGGEVLTIDPNTYEPVWQWAPGGYLGNNSYDGLAIGTGAVSENGSIALGDGAESWGMPSIQLGAGINTADYTFQVWDTTLLNAQGRIPADTLGTVPDTCKESGKKCTLVIRWDEMYGEFNYSWELD